MGTQTTFIFDPPSNGSFTSGQAAARIKSKTQQQKIDIESFVMRNGVYGATRDEIEAGLKMQGSTVRPRVLELIRDGRLEETLIRRLTRSGREAFVLIAK